jgi:hypothetical protein
VAGWESTSKGCLVLVELLYIADCPNREVAAGRLSEVVRASGRPGVVVRERLVEDEEQALVLGFVGSPSIRVDGVDPFVVGGEQVGLCCRVYRTAEGLQGAPTRAQLLEVLG